MSIYRRVFRYYRPFLPQTVAGLLLSLIGIGRNLLKPWPFQIIVDQILPRKESTQVNELVLFSGHHRFAVPLSISASILVLCLALVVIQFLWGLINWITNYILVK